MAAKDYKLLVSAFGTPYIGKTAKNNPIEILEDRREIPIQELYGFINQYAREHINKGDDTFMVTAEGKPKFEIKIYK